MLKDISARQRLGISSSTAVGRVFLALICLLACLPSGLAEAQSTGALEPGSGELRYDLPGKTTQTELKPAPVSMPEPAPGPVPRETAAPAPVPAPREFADIPDMDWSHLYFEPTDWVEPQQTPQQISGQTTGQATDRTDPETAPEQAVIRSKEYSPLTKPRQTVTEAVLSAPEQELPAELKAAVPETLPTEPEVAAAPQGRPAPEQSLPEQNLQEHAPVAATAPMVAEMPEPAPQIAEGQEPVSAPAPEKASPAPEPDLRTVAADLPETQEPPVVLPNLPEWQPEDIGYGEVKPVAGLETTQPPRTGNSTITARERTPEERDVYVALQRDERVPQNLSPNAWVAAEHVPQSAAAEELPWELTADKVTAYSQNNVIEAEGNVLLQRGREYLKADFVRYFDDTGWAYLNGNVDIFFGTDNLKGEQAEFDVPNKIGWIKNGQVFMGGPHVYLDGERINKNWGDTYTFRNAKITTCDGDVPAWSLFAEDAVVELEGYARLWGSSLSIKDQPVVYFPYMVMPAKADRQSGFLMPTFGHSDRKGYYWNQPYFWAIDESRDLTLNAHIMTERGVMFGAEYRSKSEWDENLWVRMDYLHDSETWDSPGDNYFNNMLRTNSDRFWLRGMYDGTPFDDPAWKVKGNIDYLSDTFLMREFRGEPMMFSYSRDTLENLFGRTLNAWSSNRVSEGVLYRDWDRFTVAAGMRYEQNPNLGNGNASRSSDPLAQKLPEINAYLHKGRIWEDFPLEVEGEGQVVYFFRREGAKGMRYDINPKFSLPLRNDYGAIIPQFTTRGSLYQSTNNNTLLKEGDSTDNSRLMPEFSLTGFTELARNYTFDSNQLALAEENVGQRRWTGMRHTIQPKAEYLKRWDRNQDALPYFDSIDRLPPRDQLTVSLINLFTVRRERVALNSDQNPVYQDDYLDLVRFKLEGGYDFDEERRSWKRDEYQVRPWMDILADITVTPGDWFSIESRTWWSPYSGDFTRMSNGFRVWEPSIGSVRIHIDSRRKPDEYKVWSQNILYRDLSLLHRGVITENDLNINRYSRPVDLLYTEIQLDYLDPFIFRFEQWYDLRNGAQQELEFSMTYVHQCYMVEAHITKDQHDTGIGLSVSLPGFWN